MTRNGVRLKVGDVHDGKVVIESGAYQITFRKGSDGKTQITSVFFVSDGSYIDKDDVPYEYARPARIRANIIFCDRQRRRSRREAKRESKGKPLQLELPFKT